MEKRIESITIRRTVDNEPDLSWIGEYTDKPKSAHFIDRKERGDGGRGELPYFENTMGEPGYLEQDYKRMEDYNRGNWCMTGIQAVSTIATRTAPHQDWTLQHIGSGGLYGIESDADEAYVTSIAKDQLSDLLDVLAALGFTEDDWRKLADDALDTDFMEIDS
jgi:hypothetical protein